jgi:hypothetical protein
VKLRGWSASSHQSLDKSRECERVTVVSSRLMIARY